MIKHYIGLSKTVPVNVLEESNVVQTLHQERLQLLATLSLTKGFKCLEKHFVSQLGQVDSLLLNVENRPKSLH